MPRHFRLFSAHIAHAAHITPGQELVKTGLALSLFGGCQKFTADKSRLPLRGDIHILVVGDPGLGKSQVNCYAISYMFSCIQMLQAASTIAPRGVYVCGNTTTSAGLTVTLHKDAQTGMSLNCGWQSVTVKVTLRWRRERSCLLTRARAASTSSTKWAYGWWFYLRDTLFFVQQQHQALLEAMEQQSISIAKAGIVCSLPTRASILAAGKCVSPNQLALTIAHSQSCWRPLQQGQDGLGEPQDGLGSAVAL